MVHVMTVAHRPFDAIQDAVAMTGMTVALTPGANRLVALNPGLIRLVG